MVVTVLSQIWSGADGDYLEGLYQVEASKKSVKPPVFGCSDSTSQGKEDDSIIPWLKIPGLLKYPLVN